MEILRRGIKVCEFADDSAIVTEELMQASTLSVSFSLPVYTELRLGDYITVEGENFYINSPLSVSKHSTGNFAYSGTLYNCTQLLKNVQYLFLDEDSTTTAVYSINTEFDLCATPGEFCDMVCRNMNRATKGGWTFAVDSDIDDESLQNITFSCADCLSALQTIADTFEIEWAVIGQQIRLSKKYEVKTGISLSYPENLLSPVEVTNQEAELSCNRLFVYGSEQNIPSGYGSTRLKMPDGIEYIEESNAGQYVREAVKVFDDVYPHRTGHVTAVQKVSGGNDSDGNPVYYWRITDSSIDFDLKSCLKDTSAKISFTGGKMVGQEFEIASNYNSSTKTMEIVATTDSYGNTVPNDTYCPSVGDSYVIIDINMPDEYITAAEKELQQKGQQYFEEYCIDQVSAQAQVSSAWLLDNAVRLHPGCLVWLKDTDMGIEKQIRITKVERTIGGKEYGYKTTITLSTFVPKSKFSTLTGKVNSANRAILTNNRATGDAIKQISTAVTNVGGQVKWKM